ncbi:MAG: hypothetical protein HY675_16295 [Chloroflexi bacterium]|nr:hypothetical protein [Chloroflexota bacterium]
MPTLDWIGKRAVVGHHKEVPFRHPDVTPTESGVFLIELVRVLTDERGIELGRLITDRYRLRAAATAKIDLHRKNARTASYQALLLPECETPLVVTPQVCFSFPQSDYPCSTRYDGAYRFKKHHYPQVGDLKAAGEESECAQFWIRCRRLSTGCETWNEGRRTRSGSKRRRTSSIPTSSAS